LATSLPDLNACHGLAPDVAPASLLANTWVRAVFAERLASLAERSTGSSTYVARAILLAESPSLDHGEITDKVLINQTAMLAWRAEKVAALYAEPPPAEVIVVAGP
jgi:feruloyl-CoA synthase